MNIINRIFSSRIFLFLLITIFSFIGINLISIFFNTYFFNVDLLNISSLLDNKYSFESIYINTILNQIGGFLLPSIIFLIYIQNQKFDAIYLNKKINIKLLIWITILSIGVICLMEFLLKINTEYIFSETLKQKFVSFDKQGEELYNILIFNINPFKIILSFILIALIAPICEEIFFRGILQNLFLKNNNIHFVAIILSVIFALFHFQFLSFLPRFIISIMLSYIVFYTKNLKYSIYIHILNNTISFISIYYFKNIEIHIVAYMISIPLIIISIYKIKRIVF